jgi:hypothetical protein
MAFGQHFKMNWCIKLLRFFKNCGSFVSNITLSPVFVVGLFPEVTAGLALAYDVGKSTKIETNYVKSSE